eukprot:4949883-Amphidinium_carterae.1
MQLIQAAWTPTPFLLKALQYTYISSRAVHLSPMPSNDVESGVIQGEVVHATPIVQPNVVQVAMIAAICIAHDTQPCPFL